MRALGQILLFVLIKQRIGLVSVVLVHYWICFGEVRIGFGLVLGGRRQYWIGYTLSGTQLV